MSDKKQTRCCDVVWSEGVKAAHPETDKRRRATLHAMPYHGGGVGGLLEFADGIVITEADYNAE